MYGKTFQLNLDEFGTMKKIQIMMKLTKKNSKNCNKLCNLAALMVQLHEKVQKHVNFDSFSQVSVRWHENVT